ncbi:MAG: VOC family protein [Actinomycetota bacterium]
MAHDERWIEPRSHGLDLDHIALAVPAMDLGIAHVAELTGAEPVVLPAEAGQWYRSGSLPLGPDTALEILAPSPEYGRFHPLGTLLTGLREPQLLFWYLATADLAALERRLGEESVPLHRVEHVDSGGDGPAAYRRAQIGKRFVSAMPQAIEWIRRTDRHGTDDRCTLTGFDLRHPDAAEHNRVLAAIGSTVRMRSGEHRLSITIDCPAGEVTIASPGIDGTPLRMIQGIARGLIASRRR